MDPSTLGAVAPLALDLAKAEREAQRLRIEQYNATHQDSFSSWLTGIYLPVSPRVKGNVVGDPTQYHTPTNHSTAPWRPAVVTPDDHYTRIVSLDKDLPSKMIGALEAHLREKGVDSSLAFCNSPNQRLQWHLEDVCVRVYDCLLFSETDTANQFVHIIAFLLDIIRLLGIDDVREFAPPKIKECTVYPDRAFGVSVQYSDGVVETDVIILNEYKSWQVLNKFGPDVVTMAGVAGGHHIDYENGLRSDGFSIIAKVSGSSLRICLWG